MGRLPTVKIVNPKTGEKRKVNTYDYYADQAKWHRKGFTKIVSESRGDPDEFAGDTEFHRQQSELERFRKNDAERQKWSGDAERAHTSQRIVIEQPSTRIQIEPNGISGEPQPQLSSEPKMTTETRTPSEPCCETVTHLSSEPNGLNTSPIKSESSTPTATPASSEPKSEKTTSPRSEPPNMKAAEPSSEPENWRSMRWFSKKAYVKKVTGVAPANAVEAEELMIGLE